MTEKQYELKEYDNGLFIQDNENNKVQYYSQSKASMNKIVDLLNEQEERIQELQQTIDTIAKDYEESHGMDIRNAEWFTAW